MTDWLGFPWVEWDTRPMTVAVQIVYYCSATRSSRTGFITVNTPSMIVTGETALVSQLIFMCSNSCLHTGMDDDDDEFWDNSPTGWVPRLQYLSPIVVVVGNDVMGVTLLKRVAENSTNSEFGPEESLRKYLFCICSFYPTDATGTSWLSAGRSLCLSTESLNSEIITNGTNYSLAQCANTICKPLRCYGRSSLGNSMGGWLARLWGW